MHYEGKMNLQSWAISYDSAADKFFLSANIIINININKDFSTIDEFC